MRILVDADACPVKEEIIEIASRYDLEVILYIDNSHELNNYECQIVYADVGIDSVDLKILSDVEKLDIVVTQDYGLASLVLLKKALAIGNSGDVYTDNNINEKLFARHISKEMRRAGRKTKNMKKRTNNDNLKFASNFEDLIVKNLKK